MLDLTDKLSFNHFTVTCFSGSLRGRLTWNGYLVVRMLGVSGGNMLSVEYEGLRRAELMVCRVRCNAGAACGADNPTVMGGTSC